ncbi:glutathione S-transferase family protein [Novosphingobium sp. ZN18A2]|uniref:glutathione S-transferase family protein n=1 Tax=Novosphingobium sp. ZN18A2 TaxID=3079861 RepID=UPI0030D3B63E
MPMNPDAAIEVTAFGWVPDFARGQVRDLRVRWALEEAGLSYRTRLLTGERPAEYYREQPWGQVPFYREGALQLFECGAIALHIAERSEALLPRDEVGRGRAIAWLFAALNSMDVPVMGHVVATAFHADEPWSPGASRAFGEFLRGRLARLGDWLGDSEWLEDRFTVGDLMMVATLRSDLALEHAPDNVVAYVRRGEARPAFRRALDAHLADLSPDPA